MFDRVRRSLRRRFRQWIERRIPPEPKIRLNQRRLFILPSAAGWAFLGVAAVLWLMATNYDNNLVFAFSALLIAVFVVAMLQSYANLAGLEIAIAGIAPAFAGQRARVDLQLTQTASKHRDGIILQFPEAEPTAVALVTEEIDVAQYVPARRRGRLVPGRLTLESRYPLGLFRVWTHIRPTGEGLVYPRPVTGHPMQRAVPARGEGPLQGFEGSEDFRELAKYRPGDSLRHVAWKAYAQGRGMLSKRYADPASDERWLDWDAFPGMDREARLSRLCAGVLAAHKESAPYGLRMPGIEIPPDRGERHRDLLLKNLALFEAEPAS